MNAQSASLGNFVASGSAVNRKLVLHQVYSIHTHLLSTGCIAAANAANAQCNYATQLKECWAGR